MMVRSFLRICHMAGALVFATTVFADATANMATNGQLGARAEITQFMESYAKNLTKQLGPGSRVEYDKTDIATNAEARSCAEPLAISAHNQNQPMSRVTLLIACGNEWSIYTPVDLNVFRPVVIATKPLANGAVVGASDVELSTFEVSQLVGTYLTTLEEVVGMGIKRPITQGRPILSQQLEQPVLIRRGESVIIHAESGELAVKMSGTALTDGRRGELIRIKNQTSARVLDARVIKSGLVTVAM